MKNEELAVRYKEVCVCRLCGYSNSDMFHNSDYRADVFRSSIAGNTTEIECDNCGASIGHLSLVPVWQADMETALLLPKYDLSYFGPHISMEVTKYHKIPLVPNKIWVTQWFIDNLEKFSDSLVDLLKLAGAK